MVPVETDENEFELKEGMIQTVPFGDFSQKFLSNSIKNHYLFRAIPDSLIWNFIPLFRHLSVTPGTEIVTQGQPENYFFLINSGYCEILIDKRQVSKVSTGFIFGEMALLASTNRKSTVRALSKCSLWVLDRQGFQEIMKIVQEMNKESFYFFINDCPFLAQMSFQHKEKIFHLSVLVKYEIKEKIANEGDLVSFIYLFKSGSAKMVKGGKNSGKIETGQIFGEASLIGSETCSTSIVCEEDSEVFFINIQTFQEVLGKDYRKILMKNIILNALICDKYAKNIPRSKILEILELFQISELKTGDVAIEGGKEVKNSVIVVCYGHISSNYQEFFSYSLIGFNNKNHLKVGTGRYKSLSCTTIAKVSITDISKVMCLDIEKYINQLHSLAFIQSIPIFNHFEIPSLQDLHSKLVKKSFKKGEDIFLEGQNHENIYIIEQGSVGMYDSELFIFRFDKGCIFGESSLKFCLREYTATALTSVSCLTITKDDLIPIATSYFYSAIDKSIQLTSSFDLNDILLNQELVRGEDRDIYLAVNVSKDHLHRCEVVYKKKIYTQMQFQHLLNQKCVVAQLSHPHIPRFIRSLSDSDCVYFFYEHLECESLQQVLKTERLSEPESQFLFLNLLCSLRYLHDKGILHRNLTTKAILIDFQGFAKLTDFSFAKETSRSLTLLATPVEYKAKEVLLGKPYTSAAELWSCGVILYEMAFGKLPFRFEDTDSHQQAVEKVLSFRFGEVKKKVSNALEMVLSQLLHDEPLKRAGIKDVLMTNWGKRVKMDDIFYGRAIPKFKPRVKRFFEGKSKFKPSKRLNNEERKNKMNFQWDEYF